MTGNLERKARRKYQTRLTFDPVYTNSPPTGSMAPARVRYGSQAGKKSQTPAPSRALEAADGDDGDEDELASAPKNKSPSSSPFVVLLPTPNKSSQVLYKAQNPEESSLPPSRQERAIRASTSFCKTKARPAAEDNEDESSDDLEEVQPRKKRRTIAKSQIVNLVSDSDGEMFNNTVIKSSPLMKSATTTPSKKTRTPKSSAAKKNGKTIAPPGDSEDDLALPSLKNSPTRRSIFGATLSSSGSKLSARKPNTLFSSGSKKRGKKQATLTRSESESDDFPDVDDLVSSTKRSTQKKPLRILTSRKNHLKAESKAKTQSEASEDEDDEFVASPLKRGRKQVIYLDDSEDESPSKRPKQVDSESDDEETVSPTKRQRNGSRRARVISSEEHALDDDASEEPVTPSKLKRNGSGRARIASSDVDMRSTRETSAEEENQDEDEDDDDEPVTPSRRRRDSTTKFRATKNEDSMDDVRYSSPTKQTRSSRQKLMRRHRTDKEKALELVKRRRAGEKIDQVTDTEESSDEEPEEHTEDELLVLSEFEDEEEESPRAARKAQMAKRKSKEKQGDVEDDEDFVVDDDEGPLGVPDFAMPLEFTQAAHKPIKDFFKDVVEWMIKNKLYKAFPRDDPIYDLAFQKLDDESTGLAKSKFTSNQWTRDFTVALQSRPHIIIEELEPGQGHELGVPKCDACNHRSHVPSVSIRFEGKAYHKRTLEDIDQESSDDSSDDSDSSTRSVNAVNQEIPPESTKWSAGKFCKANAEYAHILYHWKYHLNEWVLDQLKAGDYLKPEELVKRESMKPKQLNKLTNDLVDTWEESGIIKGLYRDYRNQLVKTKELTAHGRGDWK